MDDCYAGQQRNHVMPSKMRLRNSRATDDGSADILANQSHAFERHGRHVNIKVQLNLPIKDDGREFHST